MLLQPGQGMGLLGAYNTGYTPINPQMNHYNSLLGRIGGMTFTQPSGSMGPVANYFDGNTLMSGSTGQPVYNLPGASYGTAQSYMDTLGRMPQTAAEIQSPYIYYRPQTDLSKIQEALKEQEAKKVEQALTQVAQVVVAIDQLILDQNKEQHLMMVKFKDHLDKDNHLMVDFQAQMELIQVEMLVQQVDQDQQIQELQVDLVEMEMV